MRVASVRIAAFAILELAARGNDEAVYKEMMNRQIERSASRLLRLKNEVCVPVKLSRGCKGM